MTIGQVKIRRYEPRDAQRLQAIRSEAFAPVFASFRAILGEDVSRFALARAEAEQAELLTRLCERDERAQIFVAEREGEAIGFVAILLDPGQQVGELGLNAVKPSEAGRGVGSALYAHALETMRQAGMRVAVVGTGGDPSHAPARRAYERVGFHIGLPSIYLYQKL